MRKQLRVDPTASIGHPMPQDHRVLPSTRNSHAAVNKPQLTSGDIPSTTPNHSLSPELAQRPAQVAGQRRYLSTEEACTILDCHKRTIDRRVKNGLLKAYRLGRTRKFLQEDLDATLEPVNPEPKCPKDSLDGHIDKQTKR